MILKNKATILSIASKSSIFVEKYQDKNKNDKVLMDK